MHSLQLLGAALSASLAVVSSRSLAHFASKASSFQQPLQLVDHEADHLSGLPAAAPGDYSWITSYTALGDSYSVGIGAGHAISAAPGLELNTNCSQYSWGYPSILNTPSLLGFNPHRTFQYLGCSGATAPAIRTNQVPLMKKAQLVTLSAGGNDADLATILNLCIYQWSVGHHASCEEQLARTNETIYGDAFEENLRGLLESVVPFLDGREARVYWVGYSRFWNTLTRECDGVTWAFSYQLWNREFLALDRREKMNALVDSVNAKIQSVCSTTAQCVYVDPQPDVDALQGHFCEPGVDETYRWFKGGAPKDRVETWFYEWGTTKDDDGNELGNISADEECRDNAAHSTDVEPSLRPDNGTFTVDLAPDGSSFESAVAHYVNLGLQSGNINSSIFLNTSRNDDVRSAGSLFGTPYGRVFHLDKFANMYVARRVLDAMSKQQSGTVG